MYDIAVVGAGPAGATFARLAARRHKILLIDKRTFPDPTLSPAPGKCCGGLLAPDAQRMLSSLGLGLPKSVLEEPQLFIVRAVDLPVRLERFYQRHYINFHRQKFDCWLVGMIPSEVDLRLGWRLEGCAATRAGFRLRLARGGSRLGVEARVLVGADGAASRVRRLLPVKPPAPPAYIAIQEWLETDSPMPYFSSLFDPGITDFYGWTIPKDGCLVLGAALLPRAAPNEKFERLKRRIAEFGFRTGKTLRREGARILRPGRPEQVYTGSGRIALIGEAAGWISPSSAEGLSYAFDSAVLLAEALAGGLDGFDDRYRANSRRLKLNLRLKRIKSRFIYEPSWRRLILRTGLRALRLYPP